LHLYSWYSGVFSVLAFFLFVPATMGQKRRFSSKERAPSSGYSTAFFLSRNRFSLLLLHHQQHIITHILSVEHQQPSLHQLLHQFCTPDFTPPSPLTAFRIISKMFTKAVIVLLLVVFAGAVAPVRSTTTFIGISTHAGNDNVHLREVNASGQRFYLNKATTTFCPKGMPKVGCSQCRFPLKLFVPCSF
jgi:hypothetical protein